MLVYVQMAPGLSCGLCKAGTLTSRGPRRPPWGLRAAARPVFLSSAPALAGVGCVLSVCPLFLGHQGLSTHPHCREEELGVCGGVGGGGRGGRDLLTSFLLAPTPPLTPQALPRRKIQLVSSNCFAEAPEKGAGPGVGWGGGRVSPGAGVCCRRGGWEVYVWVPSPNASLCEIVCPWVPTSVPYTHVAPWEPLSHPCKPPSPWAPGSSGWRPVGAGGWARAQRVRAPADQPTPSISGQQAFALLPPSLASFPFKNLPQAGSSLLFTPIIHCKGAGQPCLDHSVPGPRGGPAHSRCSLNAGREAAVPGPHRRLETTTCPAADTLFSARQTPMPPAMAWFPVPLQDTPVL